MVENAPDSLFGVFAVNMREGACQNSELLVFDGPDAPLALFVRL